MKTVEITVKNNDRVTFTCVDDFKVIDGSLYIYGSKKEVFSVFAANQWEYILVIGNS